jgi:hypothetical protein
MFVLNICIRRYHLIEGNDIECRCFFFSSFGNYTTLFLLLHSEEYGTVSLPISAGFWLRLLLDTADGNDMLLRSIRLCPNYRVL